MTTSHGKAQAHVFCFFVLSPGFFFSPNTLDVFLHASFYIRHFLPGLFFTCMFFLQMSFFYTKYVFSPGLGFYYTYASYNQGLFYDCITQDTFFPRFFYTYDLTYESLDRTRFFSPPGKFFTNELFTQDTLLPRVYFFYACVFFTDEFFLQSVFFLRSFLLAGFFYT